MRHGIAGYKLSRTTEHRKALFRNLAAALFQHGQITTTHTKAKAVQPFVEKLITLARKGDLHARRRAFAILRDRKLINVIKGGAEPEQVEDKTLLQKLFSDIAPQYADRSGGYTRIIKLGTHRIGDGGDKVVLQLVGTEDGPKVKGRYSRRRKVQDNRTAYAAKLRKDAKAPAATEAETPAPQAPAPEAPAVE
jgi:large subunit ribosomal protein L17